MLLTSSWPLARVGVGRIHPPLRRFGSRRSLPVAAARVSTYKQSGMDRFVCQIWIASSLTVSLLDTELVESTPILHPEPQSNSPQHPGRWRPFTNTNGEELHKYDDAFGTLFG